MRWTWQAGAFWVLAFFAGLVAFMPACASVQQYDVFQYADSPEKVAYASLRLIEATQAQVADLAETQELSEDVKQALVVQSEAVTGVAESIVAALVTFQAARDAFAAGVGPAEDVEAALIALDVAIKEGRPAIVRFVDLVGGLL